MNDCHTIALTVKEVVLNTFKMVIDPALLQKPISGNNPSTRQKPQQEYEYTQCNMQVVICTIYR